MVKSKGSTKAKKGKVAKAKKANVNESANSKGAKAKKENVTKEFLDDLPWNKMEPLKDAAKMIDETTYLRLYEGKRTWDFLEREEFKETKDLVQAGIVCKPASSESDYYFQLRSDKEGVYLDVHGELDRSDLDKVGMAIRQLSDSYLSNLYQSRGVLPKESVKQDAIEDILKK